MVELVNARIFSSGGANVGSTLEGRLKVDAQITGGSTVDVGREMLDAVLVMPLADTEYSYLLPDGCKAFEFRNRGTASIRYAFLPGVVATSIDPYHTLPSNWSYGTDIQLDLIGVSLYFASSTAAQTIELLSWS
jgi:hypothetical protein